MVVIIDVGTVVELGTTSATQISRTQHNSLCAEREE